MGHRISSFQFDVDGSFATGVSTATANYTTGNLNIDGFNFAIADLGNVTTAMTELIGQATGDGTTYTQEVTSGGNTIIWDPVAQTIKLGSLATWPKAKAESFISAVDTYL